MAGGEWREEFWWYIRGWEGILKKCLGIQERKNRRRREATHNIMTDPRTILTTKFPKTEERAEGRLAFLEQDGLEKIEKPILQHITKLDFYKAKFFTGYRSAPFAYMIIGVNTDNELFLLANPVFSDKYSDLVKQFEKIKPTLADHPLTTEIVDLYKETGAKITQIGNYQYQIWFGQIKWRILDFEINGTLRIKMTPNSRLPIDGQK